MPPTPLRPPPPPPPPPTTTITAAAAANTTTNHRRRRRHHHHCCCYHHHHHSPSPSPLATSITTALIRFVTTRANTQILHEVLQACTFEVADLIARVVDVESGSPAWDEWCQDVREKRFLVDQWEKAVVLAVMIVDDASSRIECVKPCLSL
jgi:hypothetical protein